MKLATLLWCLGFVLHVNSQDTVYVVPDTLMGVGHFVGGLESGDWTYYWVPTGKVQSSGRFWNGRPVGTWHNWLIDGRPQNVVNTDSLGRKSGSLVEYDYRLTETHNLTFERDTLQGPAFWVTLEGIVLIEGQFNEGEKIGLWKGYHRTGKLLENGEYENGLAVGVWKYYHPNGQMKCIGSFIEGKENGEWVWYNEDGSELGKGWFDNGIRRKDYERK